MFVNCKIKFESEKQRYTVKRLNKNFAICVKPFNPLKTCLYTIIDFKKNIRGRHDLIFNVFNFKNEEDLDYLFEQLNKGDIEVSRRNNIPLDIERVDPT